MRGHREAFEGSQNAVYSVNERPTEPSHTPRRKAGMISDFLMFLAGLIVGVVGMLLFGGYVNG